MDSRPDIVSPPSPRGPRSSRRLGRDGHQRDSSLDEGPLHLLNSLKKRVLLRAELRVAHLAQQKLLMLLEFRLPRDEGLHVAFAASLAEDVLYIRGGSQEDLPLGVAQLGDDVPDGLPLLSADPQDMLSDQQRLRAALALPLE